MKTTLRVLGSLFALALVACGSSSGAGAPSPDPTTTDTPGDTEAQASGLCKDLDAYGSQCTGGGACDASLASSCSSLASVLNQSLLDAAATCLTSTTCGDSPTTCLVRSVANAKPTDAHQSLAKAFCACLPTGKDDCVSAVAKNEGPAQAALAFVTPLSDDVTNAIADACTTTVGCSATFETCASGVLTQKIAEAVDPDAAECVAKGVLDAGRAASGPAPSAPPPASTCAPKSCRDLGQTCGTHPDGCGGTASCGACPTTCTKDAFEPDDSQAAAHDLGPATDSPDTAKSVESLEVSDGDEDWFKMKVADTGFDGNPRIDVTVTGDEEVSIFYVCDSQPDYSYCPDGATENDATIGHGCIATHTTALKTSCSGIDETGTAYVRVRKTTSDGMCTTYVMNVTVQ